MMISIFKVTTTGAPMKSITTTTFALTLALVGCGDQAEPADVDATSPDAASPDAAIPRRTAARRSRAVRAADPVRGPAVGPPARINSRAPPLDPAVRSSPPATPPRP
jgi:hypothetical protein